MKQSWCFLVSLSFLLLLGLCSISRAEDQDEVVADTDGGVMVDNNPIPIEWQDVLDETEDKEEEEKEEKCDVRMNGVCFADLEEATHALAHGQQADKPKTPQGSSAKFHWSPKRVVIELKSGTIHRGNFLLRADRDLKSLIITTSDSGRAVIDCGDNHKAGLTFENVINSTTLAKLEVRRCSPALHFPPSFAGERISVRNSYFHGNAPDRTYEAMSLLIESDKPFDHPDNGIPLRYTDAYVREVWLSEDAGLTQFPMQLSREDEDLVRRLDVVVRNSLFRVALLPEKSTEKPGEGMVDWDNGMDYYLNKIYKKVGVKTDSYMTGGRTHMLAHRRISGQGIDSYWDIDPPFRPNEVNHNSPGFRRMLAQNGIY